MAIASRAAECAQLLDRHASTITEDQLLIQETENQIFRFNLWTTNNFVLAPSRASMDWRLRNAPFLQSTMVELLDDLKADLTRWPNVSHDVDIPLSTTMQLEDHIQAVSDTLDSLFRMSRAIRRSGILRRYIKIGNYIEVDENGINLTEAFRDGVKMLIEFRMKESKASDDLRQRVVDTICSRQQYFSYLKARKDKNTSMEKTDQLSPSPRRPTLKATVSVTGSLTPKAPVMTPKGPSHMPRGGPSIFTATTAQPDRMEKAYSAATSGNEKTSRDLPNLSDADIPLPPKIPRYPVRRYLEEAECPYCFLIYPIDELSGAKWRRHIIQDLMPYFCVMESCPTPGSLFESGKDWLSHMKNQHPASGWVCVDSTHDTTICFQTESEFMSHLERDPKANLSTMISGTSRPHAINDCQMKLL